MLTPFAVLEKKRRLLIAKAMMNATGERLITWRNQLCAALVGWASLFTQQNL